MSITGMARHRYAAVPRLAINSLYYSQYSVHSTPKLTQVFYCYFWLPLLFGKRNHFCIKGGSKKTILFVGDLTIYVWNDSLFAYEVKASIINVSKYWELNLIVGMKHFGNTELNVLIVIPSTPDWRQSQSILKDGATVVVNSWRVCTQRKQHHYMMSCLSPAPMGTICYPGQLLPGT